MGVPLLCEVSGYLDDIEFKHVIKFYCFCHLWSPNAKKYAIIKKYKFGLGQVYSWIERRISDEATERGRIHHY